MPGMDGVVLLSAGSGQWAAGGVSERRTWKGLLREWRMRTATERTALQIAARKSGHPAPKVAPRRQVSTALTRAPRCGGGAVLQTGILGEMQGLDLGSDGSKGPRFNF